MHLLRYLALIVILASLHSVWGQSTLRPPDFHTLAEGSLRHVVAWNNPAASGPLRVLAIAPHATLGDVAQLRAHVEMDLETVALWNREFLGFDPRFPQPEVPEASREAVLNHLERGLRRKKLDLILLVQCDPSILPESIQTQLIERVNGGAGLLLSNYGMESDSLLARWLEEAPRPEIPPTLLQGVGSLGIDRAFEAAMLTTYTPGEGRVAHLVFHHAPTTHHGLLPLPVSPYAMRPELADNGFSLLAKTAQWLTRQTPPLQILEVLDVSPKGPDDEEIPPGYPPEFIEAIRKNAFTQPLRPYAVHLSQPAEESLEVWYRLRPRGISAPDYLRTSDIQLRKGAQFYPLDVVAAPGNYFLDVWLKNRKGIVAWHSEHIHIPGWPTLSNVQVSRDQQTAVWIQPNDRITVHADVDQSVLSTKRVRGTVYARVVDSFGRQVASNTTTVGGEGGTISLPLVVADLLAPMVTVEVFSIPDELADESSFIEQAAREIFYLPVRLPLAPLDSTVIVTTTHRPDHAAYEHLRILRDNIGVDVLHAPLTTDMLLAAGRLGLNRLSQLLPVESSAPNTDVVRTPCLSSPAHQQNRQRQIEAAVLQAYAGGPAIYSLGSGNALTHTEAEVCQSPTCLARFHQHLKQRYGTLDALSAAWGQSLLSWEDALPPSPERALETGNPLPWLDFRLSMNQVFAEDLRESRNQAHRLDPQAQIGFQPGPQVALPQAGYQWDLLCANLDYVAVPLESNAIRRLQSFHGARPGSGVVIDSNYFSGPEVSAKWLAWHTALERLPTLWLDQPFDDTAMRLMGPTGIMNPSLTAFSDTRRALDQGLAALLLSATPYRNGIAILDTPEDALISTLPGTKNDVDAYTETWFSDTLNAYGYAPRIHSLHPALGQSLEEVNTLILANTHTMNGDEVEATMAFHKRGGLIIASRLPMTRGQSGEEPPRYALPFLHPVDSASHERMLWSNRPVWSNKIPQGATPGEQLQSLVTEAGNRPMPPIRLADNQRASLAQYYYAFGDALIQAYLPRPDVTRTLKRAGFSVPDESYTYDLRAAEPLATRSRVQWSPAPGEAAIYVTLPYRVKNIEIEGTAAAPPGDRYPVTIRLDTGDTTPTTHLISLQVLGADDKELLHYRQLVTMTDGEATTFVPLAENEGPVRLTLVATDLLTGTRTEYYVTVA